MQSQFMKIRISDGNETSGASGRNPRILFVLKGSAEVQTKKQKILLNTEDFIAVNSLEEYSVNAKGENLIGIIEIDYPATADYLSYDKNVLACSSFGKNRDAVSRTRRLIRKIFGYYEKRDSEEAPLLSALYCELLYELRTSFSAEKPFSIIAKKRNEEANDELIRSFLEKHYLEKVTLKDLSEQLFFSEAYLSRYIKKHFGKNFVELLSDIRLDHAEMLLKETDQTVIKVAMDSGFPNTAALNRAFQDKKGITPSDFRKQEAVRREKEAEAGKERELELNDKIRDFFRESGELYRSEEIDVQRLIATDEKRRRIARFWSKMINGGSASDLLRADTQSHILFLKKEIGFEYIRFWDIWSPELKLYDGNERNRYSFSGLDPLIAFFYDNGLVPYIDIGFKPVQLMKDTVQVIAEEERMNPFRTEEEYGLFIEKMLRHYVWLYGAEFVEKWYLELWFDRRMDSCEHYIDIFENVYGPVKKYLPGIHIGGMGSNREKAPVYKELLDLWNKSICPPDFISVYSYPFDNGFLNPENIIRDDPKKSAWKTGDYNLKYIGKIHEIMDNSGFSETELHLSEWNFTYVNRDPINDSPFKGSYVVKNLIDMCGNVDLAGYWIGSDLFSSHYDTAHLVDGSAGLLTRSRICKPAFFGFQFFSQLYDYLLEKDENSIITTNGRGGYRVVSHNYCHPEMPYYERFFETNPAKPPGEPENIIADYSAFFEENIRKFRIVIRNVPNGRYYIKMRLLDKDHGSVSDEWRKMGFTDLLNARDIEYLRGICVPQITVETAVAEKGELCFDFSLAANAILSIHAFRAE